MKRMAMVIVILLFIYSCSSHQDDAEELRVYNWGEFMDKSLIRQFEKKFNARVIYEEFNSNEQMYNKLQDGSKYDILVPSDYMIQRLREEDFLMKLDYSKIPNYKYVLPDLKDSLYDPDGQYSVPYFWGNVGIVYNKENVSVSDLEKDGWNIFLNKKYKDRIYFYDSERDAFMVALKALGYSVNTSDEKELNQAYEWLVQMLETMNPIYALDDTLDNMANGIKDLALVYSGDATWIISQNETMDYFVPKEGTNIWVDGFVIPKNSSNPELAHAWINFMLEKDSALANTLEVGYTSPIQEVIDEVTAPNAEFANINSYISRRNNLNDEEFIFDQSLKIHMSDLWSKVKIGR